MSPHHAEDQSPTVDVHAHILLPALQQLVADADPEGFGAQQALEVRRNGPESMAASGRMIKERWPQLTDLDRRLADMDAQGVDVQLVSPSPSHFYYFAGVELALQVDTANLAVRGFVDRAPGPAQRPGPGPAPAPCPHGGGVGTRRAGVRTARRGNRLLRRHCRRPGAQHR